MEKQPNMRREQTQTTIRFQLKFFFLPPFNSLVDLSGEGDLGRLERVVGGEVDVEEEDASLERTIGRTCGGK